MPDKILENSSQKSAPKKSRATQVKISDLLKNPGSHDEVHITEFLPENLPVLAPGLDFTLELHSIDDATIEAQILDLSGRIQEISDVSLTEFARQIDVLSHSAKFLTDHSRLDDESDTPVFPIDGDHIDIAEFLHQAIKLHEPIVKMTPDEAAARADSDEILDDTDTDLDPFDADAPTHGPTISPAKK